MSAGLQSAFNQALPPPVLRGTAGAVQQAGEEIAALGCAAVAGKGAHRLLERHLVGRQWCSLLSTGTSADLSGAQGSFQERQRGSAHKDSVGRAGHDRFGVGGNDPRGLDPVLTAAEEIDQVLELNPLREAVLLLGLTDAGERQGVEQLGRHARAAAAGGHCHRRMQAGSGHVTAVGMKACGPMNKTCEKLWITRMTRHGRLRAQ